MNFTLIATGTAPVATGPLGGRGPQGGPVWLPRCVGSSGAARGSYGTPRHSVGRFAGSRVPATTASTPSPHDLPLLRELTLDLYSTLDFHIVARGFVAAHPLELRLPYVSLINADCLPTANSAIDAESSISA